MELEAAVSESSAALATLQNAATMNSQEESESDSGHALLSEREETDEKRSS